MFPDMATPLTQYVVSKLDFGSQSALLWLVAVVILILFLRFVTEMANRMRQSDLRMQKLEDANAKQFTREEVQMICAAQQEAMFERFEAVLMRTSDKIMKKAEHAPPSLALRQLAYELKMERENSVMNFDPEEQDNLAQSE